MYMYMYMYMYVYMYMYMYLYVYTCVCMYVYISNSIISSVGVGTDGGLNNIYYTIYMDLREGVCIEHTGERSSYW
jgi:hypothetical protein